MLTGPLKLGKVVVGSIDSAGALYECHVHDHFLSAGSTLCTVKGTLWCGYGVVGLKAEGGICKGLQPAHGMSFCTECSLVTGETK